MSQEDIGKIGFSISPIVPVNYFGAGPLELKDSISTIKLNSKMGYQFGMLWRSDFDDRFSFETGIIYCRRNFLLTGTSNLSGNYTADTCDYGYINYSFPLKGFVYIQIGENVFINSSAGVNIDFYASDVASVGDNLLIDHYSERARWINASINSGLGVEWRDEEKGVFYFGAGVNIPISSISVTYLKYYYARPIKSKFDPVFLKGNFLNLVLKYYLPNSKKKEIN